MVSLISYLNLSNCHCCNYTLVHYFSAITSCPICHRHWNYFISFLFTTIWIHWKDTVESPLRFPFSLSSPNSFSCNFWPADFTCSSHLMCPWLLCVHLWMYWRYCLTVLKQAGLPHVCYPVRDLFSGCVSAYWGPGRGMDPCVKGGTGMAQHFAACNRDSENISHPSFSSYLFHYIECSGKGDL